MVFGVAQRGLGHRLKLGVVSPQPGPGGEHPAGCRAVRQVLRSRRRGGRWGGGKISELGEDREPGGLREVGEHGGPVRHTEAADRGNPPPDDARRLVGGRRAGSRAGRSRAVRGPDDRRASAPDTLFPSPVFLLFVELLSCLVAILMLEPGGNRLAEEKVPTNHEGDSKRSYGRERRPPFRFAFMTAGFSLARAKANGGAPNWRICPTWNYAMAKSRQNLGLRMRFLLWQTWTLAAGYKRQSTRGRELPYPRLDFPDVTTCTPSAPPYLRTT